MRYEQGDACPPQETFVSEVRARTTRVVFVEEGEQRLFAVHVAQPGGKPARGRLTITSGARSAVRDVEGTSCGEVVSALALIAALAVDPHASTKPVEELAPAPPPPDPPAPPQPEPPPEPPEPPALPPVVRAEPLPLPPPPRPGWSLAAGPDVEARINVLPGVAPAFGAFVSLGHGTRGSIAPVLVLSGRAAPSQTRQAQGATASFTWATGRLEGCPITFAIAPALRTSPCALFEAGFVTASAENLSDPQDTTRSWLAGGASVRTTWDLSRLVFIGASLSAVAPLRRDRFYAAPGTTFWEIPAVGFGGSLGLGFLLFS